ncbi:MAG: FapA family protein, partial [Bacillota bacterium]|nr:FapA family protein [Bacillota bacterium]
MDSKVIFNNEYLTLTSNWDGVYIETHQKGFSFDKLNSILSAHPEIEINNFTALKLSINNAPKPPEKIGRIKERISIELLDNDMKATVTLNVPAEELKPENRTNLSTEVMEKLDKLGVIEGIKSDALLGELKPCIPHIIAEGIRPVDGSDSIVQTYEMHEIKPEVDQDASVDFYDLRLINSVKAGEWLGERVDATDGTPG